MMRSAFATVLVTAAMSQKEAKEDQKLGGLPNGEGVADMLEQAELFKEYFQLNEENASKKWNVSYRCGGASCSASDRVKKEAFAKKVAACKKVYDKVITTCEYKKVGRELYKCVRDKVDQREACGRPNEKAYTRTGPDCNAL